MPKTEFNRDQPKFQPQDFVIITLFDIKYQGRVARCIYEIGGWLYDIQYVDDRGDFKRGEFSGDELRKL